MSKKQIDLLKKLQKDLIELTPEALKQKLEFNNSLVRQLKESIELGTLTKSDASNTIMILSARMMMDGFITEGIDAISYIEIDYIKNKLFKDLESDPAFDKEMETLLMVLEGLLPNTSTDTLLEGNKNFYV